MGAIIWQKISSSNPSGGVNANFMGSYPHPRDPIIPFDYEYILIFKKKGECVVRDEELREKSRLTKEEWIEYVKGHWHIKGEPQNKGLPSYTRPFIIYIATFPIEIPNRLIKMYSFYGETILDCFLGSGTTMRSARNLKRNCIGYEINKDFLPLIKKKALIYQKSLSDKLEFKIILD